MDQVLSPHLTYNIPYSISMSLLLSVPTQFGRLIPLGQLHYPHFQHFLFLIFQILKVFALLGAVNREECFPSLGWTRSNVLAMLMYRRGPVLLCSMFIHRFQNHISISVKFYVDVYFLSPILNSSSHIPRPPFDVAQFASIVPLIQWSDRVYFYF